MPIFNVEEFIAEVRSRGLARPNRYEVAIMSPLGLGGGGALPSLLCEISGFPGMNILTKPYRIYGPAHQMPITPEYGGEGISMTFLLDNDMVVKDYFDRWMHLVIAPAYFHVNYREDYISDIIIRQLNENDETTYTMVLREAFPRSMTLLDLNHTQANMAHRLNVVFAFRYWETLNIQHTGIVGPGAPVDPLLDGDPFAGSIIDT